MLFEDAMRSAPDAASGVHGAGTPKPGEGSRPRPRPRLPPVTLRQLGLGVGASGASGPSPSMATVAPTLVGAHMILLRLAPSGRAPSVSHHLDVRGSGIEVTLTKLSLTDPDAALLVMASLVLELAIDPGTPADAVTDDSGQPFTWPGLLRAPTVVTHRELTVSVGTTAVHKASFTRARATPTSATPATAAAAAVVAAAAGTPTPSPFLGASKLATAATPYPDSALWTGASGSAAAAMRAAQDDGAALVRTRPVFVLPPSLLNMESWQPPAAPLVAYALLTDFEGTVDVSLNVAHYQYLQDLMSAYVDQFRAQGAGAAPATALPPPTPLSAVAPTGGAFSPPPPPGRAARPTSMLVGASPPVTVAGAEAAAAAPVVFHALIPVQLEPQLKALGDATPPLNSVLAWLGVDRAAIPASIHTGVTVALEGLLCAVGKELLQSGAQMSDS